MATNATWTVVFDDRKIEKQTEPDKGRYKFAADDSFWNDSKWSNVWAIQYVDDNLDHNDTVEFRDDTPHASWNEAGLGDFRSQFISKWEAAHLEKLQYFWDNDNHESETEAEKIARLGARPTSYTAS